MDKSFLPSKQPAKVNNNTTTITDVPSPAALTRNHASLAMQRLQAGGAHPQQMRQDILTLQKTIGNRAVVQLLAQLPKQAAPAAQNTASKLPNQRETAAEKIDNQLDTETPTVQKASSNGKKNKDLFVPVYEAIHLNSPSTTETGNSFQAIKEQANHNQPLQQLIQGHTFSDGYEQHHLYLGAYQGEPTIMLASDWPFPFYNYIEKLEDQFLPHQKKKSPAEKIMAFNNLSKTGNEAEIILQKYYATYKDATDKAEKEDKWGNPIFDYYNNDSIAIINEFLSWTAEYIAKNIQALVQISPTKELKSSTNDAGFQFTDVPNSDNIQYLSPKIFKLKNNKTYQLAQGVKVETLTAKGNPGTIAAASPTSDIYELREILGQQDKKSEKSDEKQKYTLGHLLHHLLHGPGNDMQNLALITNNLNTETSKEGGAEAWARDQIVKGNQVLNYNVTVDYNTTTPNFYEEMLPIRLVYNLTMKKLTPGAIPTEASSWKDDFSEQKPYPMPKLYEKKKLIPIPGSDEDPITSEFVNGVTVAQYMFEALRNEGHLNTQSDLEPLSCKEANTFIENLRCPIEGFRNKEELVQTITYWQQNFSELKNYYNSIFQNILSKDTPAPSTLIGNNQPIHRRTEQLKQGQRKQTAGYSAQNTNLTPSGIDIRYNNKHLTLGTNKAITLGRWEMENQNDHVSRKLIKLYNSNGSILIEWIGSSRTKLEGRFMKKEKKIELTPGVSYELTSSDDKKLFTIKIGSSASATFNPISTTDINNNNEPSPSYLEHLGNEQGFKKPRLSPEVPASHTSSTRITPSSSSLNDILSCEHYSEIHTGNPSASDREKLIYALALFSAEGIAEHKKAYDDLLQQANEGLSVNHIWIFFQLYFDRYKEGSSSRQ